MRKRNRFGGLLLASLAALALSGGTGRGEERPPGHGPHGEANAPHNARPDGQTTQPGKQPEKAGQSSGHVSVTEGDVTIDGKTLHYKASAGDLTMKDETGKPKADVFYVAYEKQSTGATTRPSESQTADDDRDAAERRARPITFVFNGGPGAAAVWMHLGCAGPRRVKLTEDGHALPPPSALESNPNCWLDATDLVFIDPVGTGYSRPAAGEPQQEFSGVQQDVAWVADFIRLYLTHENRWPSPKFLAGESYGTTRAAALSEHLLEDQGIALNGIVFISTVLNFQNLSPGEGNDLPYALYLPSYTATAAYHKKLAPDLAGNMPRTLDEVKRFALSDYLADLAQGNGLQGEARAKVAKTLSRYTGLPADLIDQANLRIDPDLFRQKLLVDKREIIGRFDGRLTGYNPDPQSAVPDFDPSLSPFYAAYATAANDYLRRTLKFDTDLQYEVLTGRVQPWDFGHGNRYLDVADNLERAMQKNPHLKVLFASGHEDLATPFLATDYTVSHLALSEALRKNVTQTYYESGHMVYHPRASAHKLHEDVRTFIEAALPEHADH